MRNNIYVGFVLANIQPRQSRKFCFQAVTLFWGREGYLIPQLEEEASLTQTVSCEMLFQAGKPP